MKNIIMSLLAGVALICSAEACHMNHGQMHKAHQGVHKVVKKHGPRHWQHKHNFTHRTGVKGNCAKMITPRHRMKADNHKMFTFSGAKQVQKRHWSFGKKDAMKPNRKHFAKHGERFMTKVKFQPRHKFTFGPTKRYNVQNNQSKHFRSAPAMMQKPFIIRKKNHKG